MFAELVCLETTPAKWHGGASIFRELAYPLCAKSGHIQRSKMPYPITVQHDDVTLTGGSPRELYCALSASRRLNIRKFASLTYRRPNDELPQREAARPRSILQSPPAPTMAGATMRGRCDMPHDPRELPAPPDLTADEVRDLGDRAAVELAEQKDRSHDEIRKTYALLKRVDEIMARR
jgi:hypothetical protein